MPQRLQRRMIPKLSRDIVAHLRSDAGVTIADEEEAALDVGAVLVRYRNTEDEINQLIRNEARDRNLAAERLAKFALSARLERNQPRTCEDSDPEPDLPPAAQGRLVG